MDLGRIVKLVVVAAVAFAIWKYGVPWVKEKTGGTGASSQASVTGGTGGCVRSAERASESFGGGLRQFVNPPFDQNAFAGFRSNVESNINAAEAECSCSAESCVKVRDAMRDLRTLVGDLENTLRNGADPTDYVQRMESIDNRINEAGELARAGK